VARSGFIAAGAGVDDPHDEPANDERQRHAVRLARFRSLHFRSRRAGTDVTMKAMRVSEMGCVNQLLRPSSALGKRAEEVDDAGKEQDDERDDGAELDDDVYIFQ